MRAVLCFYQFWGLCFHCCGVPDTQKQWLNSLTPRISPLSASNNIPWLVHVAETCHGIILNRWWILSTASCLIKLKLLPSDILGATGKQDILFGQKICLYPSFNPRVTTDPVKGNIGVVLLQYFVRREEMPLSHTYNIFQKSCYNCQYRNCRVYQYQNHSTFGTRIKNLSVKLLDLSSCHHQHLHLTQSKKLCIWSQAQEDCRVQRGSPVLCLSGNHWGLVGLVSGSSAACYDPILVIKTAPYLTWMRWFIKACQKPLDSTFSLPCCFSPGVEHGPQNGLILNRGSAIWTSHGLTIPSYGGRLGTLPLNRQRRDHPPVFSGSNNRDSFPGSRHLHLQSSQLSSASRLPMVKPWTSPIAKPWDPSEIANPWSTAVAGTSEPWVLSDPQHPPTADIVVPRDLPQEDAMKHQYQTVTDSARSWVKTLAGLTGLHSLPVVNAGESRVLFSSGIEGSQVSSEITTVHAHFQSTKVPLHYQFRAGPWLEIIPDIGPWAYSVPEKTGTMMQIQASVDNIRTQMYHVANKVNPVVKPVTYNVHPQAPLRVNESGLRSHSTLSANRYHSPTAAQTLEPWFQPLLHIIGSQELIEKKDEYSMLPESKSNQSWTSSALNMPFTLSPSAANAVRSWEQYKASIIRPTNKMDRIGLQSKHETIILQPQRKTEDTTWLSFHPISNVIESFVHSTVDIITPRTQTKADVIRTWTQSETQAGRLLTLLKADTIRPSLQTQAERIVPWIQRKFQIVRLTTHTEEGKDKHWAQQEADTIRSWTSTDTETIRSWKQQEADIAGSWFWINSNQMSPRTQPDFKTLHPWIQPELNTVRLWWTQSQAGGTQPWAKPEASTFRFRTQSRVNTVTHWTRPEANAVTLWLQTQNDIIRNSTQPDSQTVISSPEPGDDMVRSWLHTQVHTFKPWTENELHRTHTWTQPESAIVRPGTQSEEDNFKLWFQTQMETVALWTEPATKIAHHWIRSEMDIVSPWNQHVEENVRALIKHDTYTVRPWDDLEGDKVRFWTQAEADTIRPWIQPDVSITNPGARNDAGTLTLSTEIKSHKVNAWKQSESKTVTPLIQDEILAGNHWKEMLANTVTTWAKTVFLGQEPLTHPVSDTVTLWTQAESPRINIWTQPVADTVTQWPQGEPSEINSWTEMIADIVTTWTQGEPSAVHPRIDAILGKATQWTQEESLTVNSWTQPVVDTVTLNTQAESPSLHSQTKSETHTVTTWTPTEPLAVNSWRQSETNGVSVWTDKGNRAVNPWAPSETHILTTWAQAETPGVNSWIEPVADTIPPWTYLESQAENPRTEAETHSVPAWVEAESLENPWTEAAASIVTPWTQDQSPAENPWPPSTADVGTPWTQDDSVVVNPWTQPKADSVVQWTESEPPAVSLREQTVSDAVASCTQAEFPKLETWTDPLTDTVTLWTQTESPVIPWTQSTASTVTSSSQPESIAVNSCTHSVTDNVTSWTMLKTESKEPWTLPEASIFSISLHPQSDTTRSLTKAENQASLLWTHPEIDNVNTWASSESGTHMSWIVHMPQAARLSAQPEAVISRSWFKTQTEKIKLWDQSESQRVVSTVNQVGAGRADLAKHETATILSWIQTKTGVFLPWNVSEGDRVRSWILSEADIIRPWVKTEDGIINPLTHPKSSTFRLWTQGESAAVRPWRPPDANTLTLLTQEEMQAEKHLTLSDINMVRPWFQTQIGAIRQGTQSESQTVTTWIQPEWQTAHPWIQQESNAVTFRAHPEGDLAELWIEAASNTATLWTHYETDILKPWTQPESQFVSSWTEVATATFWYSMQNDAIRPSYQLEPQMTCSVTQNEVGIVSPWIQYECNSIRSWAKPEIATVQPWIHLVSATIRPWSQAETWGINPSGQADADSVRRHWFQSQMDPIKPLRPPDANTVIPWAQPKTQTLPIWTKTEKQVVKPVALSAVDTITPWLQTRSDTTRPWIHPDSWTGSPWTQSKVGIVRSWTQQTGDTNQPWTYPETQPVKPWINLEADTVRSWFQIQRNKVRPQTHSASQVFSHWFQPEAPTVTSWRQPGTQEGRLWAHSKTEIIASSAIVKTNKVRTWIQPEIEIKPGSLYKADAITSSAPLETEAEAATPLSSRFGSWSERVPFLQMETIPSPQQYFITALPTEITASESQSQINPLQPSELTDILLLTLSSTWLPERVGYLNFGRALQMTKIKGSSDVPSDSPSPLSPSFSFLAPCSLPSPWTLSPSCSVFVSCTFPSSCIFPSHSILSPMAFTPVLFPLGSLVSSLQELSSSNFTEETFLSHAFTSLLAAPATVLTKQPYLVPGSQSESKSNQSEQDPLKYPELNISLAECRLGLLWRESLQGFWLFKTAVISQETTVCGLRPGLVPHCPNCWKAEVGEFPWMVSVQLSFNHFCAGSILNKQWILTTARCANFIKYSEARAQVQVGLIDLQHPAQAQTVGIHRAMPYLGPKGPLGPGLIFLKQPLHFQPLVLPICLEDNLEQEKNIQFDDCWLPSWSLMRGSPRILQKRHLSILKVSTCARFWPQQNEFTFCVEAKKAMGEAGCKGDLGAPLVCHLQQKDTWVQVGILTHFDEHCTKPYVFSQVSPFFFWLQGVTRPSHAPWSQQGPMTTSASTPRSVSTSTNASAVASTPASIRPHFISLPHPQTLADRISLRYAMPWQAMIISCGHHICSGSIVSSSWVLTAAHCVRDMNPEDTAVILGLRHPGAPLRVVKVSSILLHERFRLVSGAARNDLALLLLQEVQTPIQLLAPLGHLRNLNNSECWLSGPRILKQGEKEENPEMLQMHVMGTSSCAHLYPDIGSFVVCFMTESNGSDANVEPVSPGSAVMCRPMSGNGSWRQIGFTSLQDLATIISPHFSWILSTSAKAGHPINQALMPWVEKPNSSGVLKQTPTLSLSSIAMIALHRHL